MREGICRPKRILQAKHLSQQNQCISFI